MLQAKGVHTVRQHKSIRNNSDRAGLVIPAVDLVPNPRGWAEVLQEPIQGICEVHLLVDRVNGNVVEGAELPAKVVVEHDCRVVRLAGVHDDGVGGVFRASALGHVEYLALVVGGSVGVDDLRVGWDNLHCYLSGRVGLVLDCVCLRQRDLLDDGRLVEARACGLCTSVLNEEDLVCRLKPASFSADIQVRNFTGFMVRGFAYQTTASWNNGSVAVSAISDKVGSEPMME